MKNLNEIKANDKVNVMLDGKFSHIATVKQITQTTVILYNGDKYSIRTGKSLLGKLSVTGGTTSIEAT